MEVHGSLNMRGNLLKQLRLEQESDFPAQPQPGRILFRQADKTVYVCVELDGALPVWAPMMEIRQMYRHSQESSALEWTIQHDLNVNPVMVQVYDETGRWVIPDQIICTNPNQVTAVFSTPIQGTAIVMRGDMFGPQPAAIAYEQSFTSSTEWVVNHGLGYNPTINVYVNGLQVQPQSIEHISTMQAKVTFSTARSGLVRCI